MNDEKYKYFRIRNYNRKKYNYRFNLLRDLYGNDNIPYNKIIECSSKIINIRNIINKVISKTIGERYLILIQIKNNWFNIVGKDICEYTNPVNFINGKLIIEVDNNILLMQLKLNFYSNIIKKCLLLCSKFKKTDRIIFIPNGGGYKN